MRDDVERIRTVLAQLIYLEARGEPIEGQIAVAWVVRNRVEKVRVNPNLKELFGSGWGGVMAKPKQFSCFNNGIPRPPSPSTSPVFAQCLWVADGVINGWLPNDPTYGADHYHAVTLWDRPAWADEGEASTQIGRHQFYRLYHQNGKKIIRAGCQGPA